MVVVAVMADGFLGRWSRRKLDVNESKALEANPAESPTADPAQTQASASPVPSGSAGANVAGIAELQPGRPAMDSGRPANAGTAPPADTQPLTLEDVRKLTSESDFSVFAGRHVDPQVKNAAMKKLFANPHFNVMDGMDVYIDDYSKPDPIPAAMLRQLASAKFLGLFDDEEEKEKLAEAEQARRQGSRDGADDPSPQSVAHSTATPADTAPPVAPAPTSAVSSAVSLTPDHADTDLRLQQDHAAPGKSPGHIA